MFSQSLLFWAWRDWAAPPDSSARSHAEMTEGSRPVCAARRAANCCWAVVSWLWAPAGRATPPVLTMPPVLTRPPVPTRPPVLATSPAMPVVCWAWARAAAKLVEAEDPVPATPVPATPVPAAPWAVAAATDGSKAVWREAIWAWIWETRLTASVKLIYYHLDRRRQARLESTGDSRRSTAWKVICKEEYAPVRMR